MELLIKTKWDNDVETIIHVVVLDSVHHENWALLCMTESGHVASDYETQPKSTCTTSFPFDFHNGLRFIEIICRFIHLRAKNKTFRRL